MVFSSIRINTFLDSHPNWKDLVEKRLGYLLCDPSSNCIEFVAVDDLSQLGKLLKNIYRNEDNDTDTHNYVNEIRTELDTLDVGKEALVVLVQRTGESQSGNTYSLEHDIVPLVN